VVIAAWSADLKQLGRYEILGELGRGAMGVVFKAHDPLIGRLVALKTITASVAEDPGLVQRFWREAKAAGALQHANIVTIHDVGEADGVPFIAMEYLEGESLAAQISRGAPVALTEKVGYLVQTCRALQYAHRRGVIHRDIKPANIVLTVDGVIKVVDFGIARVSDASHTHTGTLLGTLGYMSPQQIRGKRADALSDIWSVGVVLYELLTGRRPFKGGNQADLMLSILQDEPVALSEALGGCPYQLETISRRTLAKNEANRYQSMEQLLLDLKSAWASMHLNKPGERAPAVGVQTAEREFAMQEAASGGKPRLPQSGQKSGPRDLPAKDARPSGLAGAAKAIDIPAIPVRELAPPPAPAIPSASVSSAERAWSMPEWGGSWQRGIAIFAAALTIVTIGLEASRLRLHSSVSTPVSAASDPVTPASNPARALSSQAVSSPATSKINSAGNGPSGAERSTPEAQFEAVVADFNQAVAAKDAAAMKSHVLPEFQRIAQGAGPRARDAAGYVSSAIPKALRSITRWPEIGCGVDLPDPGIDAQAALFAACGALDPPKLQWVQFSWPEFPVQARQAGLGNGVALLSVTVDQRGSVIAARSRVPSDPFGFTDAAIQAALKWKTTMPRAGGTPVRTQFSVDVPFDQ
jgi:TonB family protein